MSLAPELLELEAGDRVVGGTFMQALDGEDVVWTCVKPFDPSRQEIVLDASWLGVDLGRFRHSAKGTLRVE